MRLVSFSVQRYRSITSAQRLPVGQLTTLIGPNNEGKSNILRALVVGMRLMTILARNAPPGRGSIVARRIRVAEEDYLWERDYPKHLQPRYPNGQTMFDFEFELNSDELVTFQKEVRSKLNGLLPIRLSIGANGPIEVSIRKPGPGATALTKKAPEIANFIGQRIEVQYVAAHRTAEEARSVVGRMVADELRDVEQSPEFRSAVEEIGNVQQPVLDGLAESLVSVLKAFLPEVKSVQVRIPPEERYTALRRGIEVVIDDGTPTDLGLKGDGVQSLAALALLRRVSSDGERREFILAVEEPEAHLHPSAIHQLRELLADIAKKQQVVITTHSPLLTNRNNINSNVLVSANKARPAMHIAQVREVLGVQTSDNLQSARLVLVVEGEDDCTALRAILSDISDPIRVALGDGELAIESLGGGTNLGYKLSHLQDSMCLFYAFLDDDEAGRLAIDRAEAANLIRSPADRSLTICDGMNEAEMEDLYDRSVYEDLILNDYNVILDIPQFRNASAKWSVRMRSAFRSSGQPWSSRLEARVKLLVANAVAANPQTALNAHRRGPVDALARALEAKLGLLA